MIHEFPFRINFLLHYSSIGVNCTTNHLLYNVEIPANTKAVRYVPAKNVAAITEGSKALSIVKGINLRGVEGDYVVTEVGSGMYRFSVN